jgi:hypothetical protein
MKKIYLNILILILIFAGLGSLVLVFSIGGCSYPNLSITVNEANPEWTTFEHDCQLIINGESIGLFLGDYNIEGSMYPNSIFGTSNATISGNFGGTPSSISVSTRYNAFGIYQELLGYIWGAVLILIVLRIVLRKKMK